MRFRGIPNSLYRCKMIKLWEISYFLGNSRLQVRATSNSLYSRNFLVWCLFWPARGCGGFVSLSLFGSRAVFVLVVVLKRGRKKRWRKNRRLENSGAKKRRRKKRGRVHRAIHPYITNLAVRPERCNAIRFRRVNRNRI